MLIVLDDINSDMFRKKKHVPIVAELFIRSRKLNISICFCYTVLFFCNKKYYTNFYALFHQINSKQTRTSTNCI